MPQIFLWFIQIQTIGNATIYGTRVTRFTVITTTTNTAATSAAVITASVVKIIPSTAILYATRWWHSRIYMLAVLVRLFSSHFGLKVLR